MNRHLDATPHEHGDGHGNGHEEDDGDDDFEPPSAQELGHVGLALGDESAALGEGRRHTPAYSTCERRGLQSRLIESATSRPSPEHVGPTSRRGAILRFTAELRIDKLTDEMMRTEAPLELSVGGRQR